jgi:Glyoxalase-like domain
MAIAKYCLVAVDCPDPKSLAAFYAGVFGGEAKEDDDGRRGFRVYADPAGLPFCLCRE